jgi:hypothetical protein
MPFIFLFAGFFFFIPIFGGDACLSVENVGYQYITRSNDTLCENFNGNGSASNCVFTFGNKTASSGGTTPNFTFALDIPRTYKEVLGGCDPTNDVLNPIYDAARGLARDYLPGELNRQVDDFNDPSANDGLKIQPSVIKVIHDLGLDVSDSTVSFVTNFQGVVGCDDLHEVYAAGKNAFCCEVMTSIYWMIASWYLIAWSMLLCGCGAALLGRKRFPYALWGQHVAEDMARLTQENSEVEDLVPNNNGEMQVGGGNPEMLDDSRPGAPSRGLSIAPAATNPLAIHSMRADSGLASPSHHEESHEGIELDHLNSNKDSKASDHTGASDPLPHIAEPVDEEGDQEFVIEPVELVKEEDSGGDDGKSHAGNDEKSHMSEGQETWAVQ